MAPPFHQLLSSTVSPSALPVQSTMRGVLPLQLQPQQELQLQLQLQPLSIPLTMVCDVEEADIPAGAVEG